MSEVDESKKSRRGVKIALIVAMVLAIAAGGVGAATAKSWLPEANSSATAGPTSPSTPTPARTLVPDVPLALEMTPAAGATFVNPAAPVVASVKYGRIKNVVLKENATGEMTEGVLNATEDSWTAGKPLKFHTDYTFIVTTVDTVANTKTSETTFSTVPPSHEADVQIYPAANATVGVGQPLQFNFSEPVTNKEAVENAIKVTTATGQVGAFRWYSDTMVRYRAADFWPANAPITIEMNLYGVDFGKGMIGNANKTAVINIGNKVVMEADAIAKQVTIMVNDVPAATFPVTMGDPGFPSASGFLVITGDKQRFATFKASTIGLKPGDKGDYGSVDVEYATRLSNSGIFIHQATPSAMPFLGVANLSHGCIGMSAEGASWVFANMRAGDLVHAVNTGNETIAPTDGYGDANIPFEQYAHR